MQSKGFTLIETLVAVLLLTVAIVSPMSLASQSLQSAYYARDQIIAYNLAQEAVEAVRAVRDGNALNNALGYPVVNLLNGIPTGQNFTVDTRDPYTTMTVCGGSGGACSPIRTDGTFYGYDTGGTWHDTYFTRTIIATYVDGPTNNEVVLQVDVKWRTGIFAERTFTMKENLYRWLDDGAGV
jgi:prepilin-type N-terminal cleavage/methylation domain-containing protein